MSPRHSSVLDIVWEHTTTGTRNSRDAAIFPRSLESQSTMDTPRNREKSTAQTLRIMSSAADNQNNTEPPILPTFLELILTAHTRNKLGRSTAPRLRGFQSMIHNHDNSELLTVSVSRGFQPTMDSRRSAVEPTLPTWAKLYATVDNRCSTRSPSWPSLELRATLDSRCSLSQSDGATASNHQHSHRWCTYSSLLPQLLDL